MKRLLLLRHAKAIAKDAAPDFDRTLAERGRSEMAVMRAALAADPCLRPDLALVSPSARTRETWTLAGMPDVDVRFADEIYEAEADGLLAIARDAPDDAASIVLVGHNPGLSELAWDLAGDEPDTTRRLAGGLPTAALAVFDFDVEAWRGIGKGTGRLDRLLTPESPDGDA